MADNEKKTPVEIDDWLDDFEETDNTGASNDQSEIDSLIDMDMDDDAFAADSSEPETAAENQDSVSQDDIDALFGETAVPKSGKAKPEEEAAAENNAVSQDDIDALFSEPAVQKAATKPAADDSPINQDDIDALLGENSAPEEETPPQKTETKPKGIFPVKQEDIDALFSEGKVTVLEEPPKKASTDEFTMNFDDSGTMSQNDLDILVNDDEPNDSSDSHLVFDYSAEEPGSSNRKDITMVYDSPEERKDSDDDTIMVGSNPMDSIAADEPVDQSELNSLFGNMTSGNIHETVTQKVEDIDQLFDDFTDADNAEEKSFQAEEVDFTDLLEDNDEEDGSFSLGNEDFNLSSDTFTLGKSDDDAKDKTEDTVDAEAFFSEEDSTEALPDFLAVTEDTEDDDETVTFLSEKKRLALPIPAILGNKKILGIAAMLVLVLLIGLYYYKKPGSQPAIVLQDANQEAALANQPEINAPPRAVSSDYKMPPGGGELAIRLGAEDMENDPLTFTITSPPAHGRISGEPPNIVYLPNNNFPGEDRFTFLAGDGHGTSEPANIVITGPNLAGTKPKAVTVAAKPKPAGLTAKSLTFSLLSTESLDLDWRKIWEDGNHAPFGKNVSIEIISKNLHGSLTEVGPNRHHYQPDPYFNGQETITYRFKRGKALSALGTIQLEMGNGQPPPQIILAPLAESYKVGQLVTLDASASKDDHRDSLRFMWQQTGGTPIRIQKGNEEGSIISFVMPSSFYKSTDPGPQIVLTAIDDSNQEKHQEITIQTISRQRAALWRGVANGTRVAVEPDCPQGRCPGEKLPWPYPN